MHKYNRQKFRRMYQRTKPLLKECAKIALFKAVENLIDLFFN